MKRICMWSGPRNISTAMMYFFHHRGDCEVVDEPFYAHYLLNSGAMHPGREEIIAENESYAPRIIENLMRSEGEYPIRFIKNMPHHMDDVDMDELYEMEHFFLIREPRAMISSYLKRISEVQMSDVGIDRLYGLYDTLRAQGQRPAIIDSADVLSNPSAVMRRLCEHLRIPFEIEMLQWPAGPIHSDGTWAKHWYDKVHASSGFTLPTDRSAIELDAKAEALAKGCDSIYQKMRHHRIRP